jgi:RHS repeat-associated protein
MPTNVPSVLARYTYDPLDRLSHCSPSQQPYIQRFYCNTRLSTEMQGTRHRSIVQHEDQLLAQHHRDGAAGSTTLLATDLQRSVHHAIHGNLPYVLAYTPYGHRPLINSVLDLLGFNGETPDRVTGHYHLGNGYREYNPVLMRFNTPDSWSPFGVGGLNAYAYCAGDPINNWDPSGHGLKSILRVNRPPVPRRLSKTNFDTPGSTTAMEAVQPVAHQHPALEDFHHFSPKTKENTLENVSTLIPEKGTKTLIEDIKRTAAQRYSDPSKQLDFSTYRLERNANRVKLLEHHNKLHATDQTLKPTERRLRFGFVHIKEFDEEVWELRKGVETRPLAQFRRSEPPLKREQL